MFSKKESKQLRELFWVSFGKSFPRKWMLYRTGISGIDLKFHFDMEKAIVALDVDDSSSEKRSGLWEKLVSLGYVLREGYLPHIIYDPGFPLENEKRVGRVYVQKYGVCIHDRQTWKDTMLFLKENMELMEKFIREYRDFLDS